MTLEEMISKKKEFGFSCEYISSVSGVPVSTVQKVFSGTTAAPRYATLKALAQAFENTDMGYGYDQIPFDEDGSPVSYVAEDRTTSGKRHFRDRYKFKTGAFAGTGALNMSEHGDKTIDDYLALPDDVRVELIDGVFYDMAGASMLHQSISIYISTVFENHINAHNGKCMTFAAPTDVQLDGDNKTIVQPDVFIICDRDKITKHRAVGAPNLVVEILSPSNFYHDMVRKLQKYKAAGVREYWIVMPDELKIIVYNFEKSDFLTEYSFYDKVPVGIWNGECEVDFSKIYEKISFML